MSATGDSDAGASDAGASDAVPVEDAAVASLRTADIDGILGRANQVSRFSPAETAVLLERLDGALEARDWRLFRATLRALAKTDDESVRRRMLAIGEDTELPFQNYAGGLYAAVFEEVRDPRLAALGRLRFGMRIDAGDTSWVAAEGWFDLVAQNGDERDIEWLLARNESRQILHRAREAVALSTIPSAVAATREWLLQRPDERMLRTFATEQPEEGLSLLEEMIRTAADAGGGPGSHVLRTYGRVVPAGDVARARDLVQRVAGPEARFVGVYAAQELARREIDVAGWSAIIEAPVTYLEQVDDASDRRARTAANAIEACPVTWSERAAAALASLATRTGEPQDWAIDAARTVRAGLGGFWGSEHD